MPHPTIHALLENVVDYAGLFPPAQLEMAPAVREYARQRRSADAWMLGRFVVPAGRLDELASAAAETWSAGDEPWGLSVLAPGELADARQRIDRFEAAHAAAGRAAAGSAAAGRATVQAIERQVSAPGEVAEVLSTFPGLEVYCEIPHQGDPSPFMTELARHGGRAKIRSGGVTADAFPTAAEVARFILAAARAGVPFKATAGLHHPLRGTYRLTYEPDSATGTMHGFLNVFLAAAWAKTGTPSQVELQALLEETDPGALAWSDSSVHWRDHQLDVTALAEARTTFATSYGSCSFQEPVDDLRDLSLL